MGTTTAFRLGRILSRIAATWDELDHAQRRLLEIRTGATGLTRAHRATREAGLASGERGRVATDRVGARPDPDGAPGLV
jgi:hypothetical protein